jgi:hypothetical protein
MNTKATAGRRACIQNLRRAVHSFGIFQKAVKNVVLITDVSAIIIRIEVRGSMTLD